MYLLDWRFLLIYSSFILSNCCSSNPISVNVLRQRQRAYPVIHVEKHWQLLSCLSWLSSAQFEPIINLLAGVPIGSPASSREADVIHPLTLYKAEIGALMCLSITWVMICGSCSHLELFSAKAPACC